MRPNRLLASILAGYGVGSAVVAYVASPTIPSLNVITVDLSLFDPNLPFPGWDGAAPSQSTTAAYPTDRDMLVLGHSSLTWNDSSAYIKGGRNVMLKGGYYIHAPAQKDFVGDCVQEGVLTRYPFTPAGGEPGDTNVMLPAASTRATSKMWSLGCRSENIDGYTDGLHGDCFQMPSQNDTGGFSGTPGQVVIERYTGTTAYQGFFLPNQHFDTSASYGSDPYENSLRCLILRDVNLKKTRQFLATTAGLDTNIGGIKLLTLVDMSNTKRGDRPYPKRFENVYVEPFGAEGIDGCIYPDSTSGTSSWTGGQLRPTIAGSAATYPSDMLLDGSIQLGPPPGGDFSPAANLAGVGGAGIAGIGYVSPGYGRGNVSLPTLTAIAISGTPQQGQTLTASATAANGTIILWEWWADGLPVKYGPGASYTCTAADVGKVITVTPTVIGAGGFARSTSAATAAVTASGAPSFDPLTQFTGLVEWVDPNDDAKVTLSGSSITQIVGEKNGYAYVQNGTVALPTITTGAGGINGRKAMSFASAALTCTNAAFGTAFTGANKPFTKALIVKAAATSSTRIIEGLGAASSQNSGEMTRISSSTWGAARQYAGTQLTAAESTGTANTSAHAVIVVYDGTTLSVYVDSTTTPVATNASVSQTSHTVANHTLGNWQPAAAQPSASFYSGLLGDVLIGSTALSGTTLSDLMAWLKYRAGL